MTQTFRHKLPLIESNQALKHVIHNEAIAALDALVQLRFSAMDVNDPPVAPIEGDCVAIGATPTGDFSTHAGEIAFYDANGWHFYVPTDGMLAWDSANEKLMVFESGVWSVLDQAPSQIANAQTIGVMTEADATNRLAVKSDAALFSHADAGADIRLKLNKSAPAATASFLFQSGWSGRAEVGLAGNDDLSIKVSNDGSIWRDALVIDSATAHVDLKQGAGPNCIGLSNKVNLLPNAGRLAVEQTHGVATFAMPSGILPENGASIVAHAKFQTDSVDYSGAGAANDADVKALADLLKSAGAALTAPEFWVASCTAGSGTNHLNTASGSNKYRVFSSDLMTANNASCSIYLCVKSGTLLIDAAEHNVWLNGTQVSGHAIVAAADGWVHVNVVTNGAASDANNWPKNLLPLFASSGDQFFFALPAILPDAVRVPVDQGFVPSLS